MAEEKSTSQEDQPAAAEDVRAEGTETEDVPEKEIQQMTTLHERTIAALSYVGFLAIIPFYLKKESKFCRFHGKQGMLIAIIFFFAKLLLVIDLLMDIALVAQFAIFVWMGLAALSGEWKKMPWIYDASCQLEDQLRLKTKEEEDDEAALKPGEVKTDEETK